MELSNNDVENLKFERTASGKYVFSFKLIGIPEENIVRLKTLQEQLDKHIKAITD